MRTLGLHDAAWMDRRVKRAPTDFGTMAFWFKSDSFPTSTPDLTPVGAAGTEWIDSSGNGFTASQAVAAARPTYRTNQFNRFPAISFDGGDFLNMALTQTIPAASNFSLAYVYAANNAVTDAFVLGNGGNTQLRNNRAGGDQMSIFQDAGAEAVSSAGATRIQTDLRVLIHSGTVAAGTRTYDFYEGKLTYGTAGHAAAAFTINRISGNVAAGFNLVGRLGEICLWTSALSSAQVLDLAQHYFRPKWGWNFT